VPPSVTARSVPSVGAPARDVIEIQNGSYSIAAKITIPSGKVVRMICTQGVDQGDLVLPRTSVPIPAPSPSVSINVRANAVKSVTAAVPEPGRGETDPRGGSGGSPEGGRGRGKRSVKPKKMATSTWPALPPADTPGPATATATRLVASLLYRWCCPRWRGRHRLSPGSRHGAGQVIGSVIRVLEIEL
jgi:hypothetical protein